MPHEGDDEDAKLRARLSKLSGDLKGRTAPPAAAPESTSPRPDGMGSAMSMGLRAGSEFVAAIIVGAGDRLGDRLARSEPIPHFSLYFSCSASRPASGT